MEYQISKLELTNILAIATQIGFQRGLESVGEAPRFVSQNKAYNRFLKSRVQTWVRNGWIKPTTNGNGKTSTVFYEYARLMELDASDKIVIHKTK